MTDVSFPPLSLGQTAATLSARAPVIWLLAAIASVAGGMVSANPLQIILGFTALTLGMLALLLSGAALLRRRALRERLSAFHDLTLNDDQPVFLTDLDGRIEVQNAVAESLFARQLDDSALTILGLYVAAPRDVLVMLRRIAMGEGRAVHALNGSSCPRMRLVVTKVGSDGLMWRLAPVAGETRTEAETIDDSCLPERGSLDSVEAYFDSLPVPMLQIDRTGMIEKANRRARNLLEDAEVVGQGLSSVVEGLGRPVREWLRDAFEGRGLHRPEVVRLAPDHRELYLQITLDQLGTGDDMRLVAILNDATELKTLEAQFVQSQKMQAIGQLAGGVAHDFNNLLTAISGHCDLLLLRRDEFDPDFADLEQINQNANRAASLVGQLLAFSRKQNLRPELLDLRHSLAELTHLLNRLVGEKVHLTFSHDPALLPIRADKRQLEQVIMNLVVNARDAMPGGGQIEIGTQVETLEQPYIRDRVEVPPGVYVVVRVRDQGVGITADKLPKLFEPFFTTKKTGEGTGLGLSTAYGIVKQTGGFIFADSEVGVGSTFSLYFLARKDEKCQAAAVTPQPASVSHARGNGAVLLVEDEAPVRAFAARALRLRGFTVVEAENGEQALELLQDPTLSVDIFVTDVIMPGLDGPSWVRQALVGRPDTKVVFVSGYSEESLTETQASIPNSIFLPKPFSLTQLTTTVQNQLG